MHHREEPRARAFRGLGGFSKGCFLDGLPRALLVVAVASMVRKFPCGQHLNSQGPPAAVQSMYTLTSLWFPISDETTYRLLRSHNLLPKSFKDLLRAITLCSVSRIIGWRE